MRKAASWRNWSGQQSCQPVSIEHPSSADDVAAVVKGAAARQLCVRVAGSGHSFPDAVCTPDVLLRLDRMDNVLEVNRTAGRVTVQAGCTLGRLSEQLSAHGMALGNLGDIDKQTVAGALSTGTHGTGAALPALTEDVLELELVNGSGQICRLSRNSDDESFRAAQLSLGALGVITSVTLRCESRFRLLATEAPQPVDGLLDGATELARQHEHFEAFVFPYTKRAIARFADRTDQPPTHRARWRAWAEDMLVGNYLFEALLAAGRAAPPLVPALNHLAAAGATRTQRVQDSHAALASRRLMRFVEMEWVLPLERAATAVRAVTELVARQRLSVNMPIELRFLAADRAFLSPAYERQSCCVAIHAYRGMTWQPYFRAVEKLMWELDGRPHWGKLHFQTFQTLSARYPEWDRFQAVRLRFDPDGRFRNTYTDRVLGLPVLAGALGTRTAASRASIHPRRLG